jgi:tetratricopeptide (TPR) repeat protein
MDDLQDTILRLEAEQRRGGDVRHLNIIAEIDRMLGQGISNAALHILKGASCLGYRKYDWAKDSFDSALRLAKEGYGRTEAYMGLVRFTLLKDYDLIRAHDLLDDAERPLQAQSSFTLDQAAIQTKRGLVHKLSGESVAARESYDNAQMIITRLMQIDRLDPMALRQRLHLNELRADALLGSAHTLTRDSNKLGMLHEALDLYKEIGQYGKTMITLNSIGSYHKREKSYDLALSAYNEAYRMLTDSPNPRMAAALELNLAHTYLTQFVGHQGDLAKFDLVQLGPLMKRISSMTNP